MKPGSALSFLGGAAFAVIGAGFALAQALDPETQARVNHFEKGPATIDVSNHL